MDRRLIIEEAGLRMGFGQDTPQTLAQFRRLISEKYAAGVALEELGGRSGNLETRVAILMRAAQAEQQGFSVAFEVHVPGGLIAGSERWLDLAIYQNGQLVRGVQGVKEVNLIVPGVINPREFGLAAQIQARLGVPVEELITGFQRPPIP